MLRSHGQYDEVLEWGELNPLQVTMTTMCSTTT
jgi:hypothetical protein